MRVLKQTLAATMLTVTQAMAAGGGEGGEVSFLMIMFMGFGAVILVFQIIPAAVLFAGMIKGLMAPATKKTPEVKH